MDITYFGKSSFRLKGKNAIVITDPDTIPKHTAADIITVSSSLVQDKIIKQIEGNPFVVTGPGEYEIKDIGIIGLKRENTIIYRFEVDGVTIAHLGTLDQVLPAKDVDTLDGVDILITPIGEHTIEVIGEIEPPIVIPIATGDKLETFIKEFGKGEVTPQSKLSITKDKIPDQVQVVVLQ